MPILNPRQAYNLLHYTDKVDDLMPFIISLLEYSSNHYDSNRNTLEIHEQFINYIIENTKLFSQFFDFKTENLSNLFNHIDESNVYKVIYDMIKPRKNDETKYKSIKLDFIGCLEQSINSKVNIPHEQSFFFIPYLDSNFGWFISDQSYAVLVYPDTKYFLKREAVESIYLFKMRLTAFLLAASGYILVSCITYNSDNFFKFPNFLTPRFFSETHIFVEINSMEKAIDRSYLLLKDIGFVYLYIHLGENINSNYSYTEWKRNKSLKKFNNIHVKFFVFSKEVNSFISKVNHLEIQSIFYDPNSIHKGILYQINKSNYDKKNISVILCNVPLYSSKNTLSDWTPQKLSGFGYGIINKSEFNYYSSNRILIIIENEDYYIDFTDLHLMNPEIFVTEPMYLAKQNLNTSIVEKVHATYKENTTLKESKKSKNENIKENIEEKMRNAFHYLHKYTKDDKGNHIEPYTSQIYAVYQAISVLKDNTSYNFNYNNYDNHNIFDIINIHKKLQIEDILRDNNDDIDDFNYLNHNRNNNENKNKNEILENILEKNKKKNNIGTILQVHTGEGKSFIVQALAEQLARQGNTVHIATSNIILAARDFEKAYNYYKNCENKASTISFKIKRPSILIHQNELKYIKDMINDRSIIEQQEYDAFYSEDNFNNSTNMNLSVCLTNNKYISNIIYSTFLNFEAFYLNQLDKNPITIEDYIDKCYLIIDEADTVLIDELINGTILSKPMKSNAEEVLSKVYYLYSKGIDKADSVLKIIKDEFPECEDITEDNINQMFNEIKLTTSDKFCNNNKYIIADKPDDNEKKIIIPFDSEHKGIAEHNKIFNGFIHQFAGIKEKEKDKNIEIHPLSMNYMFISHPIYIRKYKGVCGITGTIGSKRDKEILKKYYKLIPQKVPRHQMNMRTDLPMIICDDIKQRNIRICEEINNFHILNYPVLAVFIDINEIDYIKKMLIDKYKIKNEEINIFSGSNNEKSETDKNKLEETGGKSGMITLGTNFCGRGISINYTNKPLCVIVSYYSEDKRSIDQVLGRAGRNGFPGMTRIICTKKMRFGTHTCYDEEKILKSLTDYNIKNYFQLVFITEMLSSMSWIFEDSEYTEPIEKSDASKLRESNININRITAFNAKFPICMSIKSFLDIQIQRIFSLKNCPECKYTWNLFKNYLRELIYESWSLFIDDVDKCFSKNPADKISYIKFFQQKYIDFIKLLSQYIPLNQNNKVIDTFFFIHDKVIKSWEEKIMNNIPKSIREKHKENSRDNSYTSFKLGFYPMSLAENSGARLTPLTPKQQKKADKGNLYIIDPELNYIKKNSNKRFSITVMLDKIFEKFQEVVDEKLQGLFGIRFFLRRTLAGCEFGVCVDPQYEIKDELLNCLIDRNPIIMLTICTKSSTPWIAGILMIVLVFVVSISILIGKRIINPSTLPTDILNLIKKAWNFFTKQEDEEKSLLDPLSSILNKIFDPLIQLLQNMINKNLKKIDEGLSIVFETILNIFVPVDTDNFDEKLSDKFFSNIKLNQKAKEYMTGTSPFGKMIKIGILFVLLIAVFILNFKHRKRLEFEASTKSEANNYLRDKKNASLIKKDLLHFSSYDKAKKEANEEIQEVLEIDSE